MGLDKQDIQEFQEIYKEKFGKDIGYKEAQDQATKLLNLYKVVYKPNFKEDENRKLPNS